MVEFVIFGAPLIENANAIDCSSVF